MTPTAPNPTVTPEQARQRARWKLLAMVLILSLPVGIAYWAYSVAQPQGQLTYGELIHPARPVGEAMATDSAGQPYALARLKGQWLLVSVQGGACPADCQQRLFLQGQLRETLGKDKDRVDSVWLVNDNAAFSGSVLAQVRDTAVLRVLPNVAESWLGAPPQGTLSDYMVVVDPLGNAMARFPAQFDGDGAKQMRRVLERLLRASVAWDPPGR